jgi:hypothetical protein
MIELSKALDGMANAQEKLRTATAIIAPSIMSEQMMRLSQYAGIVDEHLAGYEKEYEIQLSAKILSKIKEGYKASPAEIQSKMELSEIRGQIVSLTRICNSAWKQVTIIQSRIRHLTEESRTNI